jgi:hypothetical protein
MLSDLEIPPTDMLSDLEIPPADALSDLSRSISSSFFKIVFFIEVTFKVRQRRRLLSVDIQK